MDGDGFLDGYRVWFLYRYCFHFAVAHTDNEAYEKAEGENPPVSFEEVNNLFHFSNLFAYK
jgi:hypothetical protein